MLMETNTKKAPLLAGLALVGATALELALCMGNYAFASDTIGRGYNRASAEAYVKEQIEKSDSVSKPVFVLGRPGRETCYIKHKLDTLIH